MLLGITCTLFGIAGIIGAFLGIFPLVIVGAVLDLFENVINFITGVQTNVLTLIIAVCSGVGYAFYTNTSILTGALIGLCWESAIMGVLSAGFIPLFLKAPKKSRNRTEKIEPSAMPVSTAPPTVPVYSGSWLSQESPAMDANTSASEFTESCKAVSPSSRASDNISAAHGYCKLCGAPLNAEHKCTGCGKQYFHIKKGFLLKLYAVAVTLALVATVFQNNWNVKNTYDWINLYQEAQMRSDSMTLRLELLQKQNDELTKRCSNLQSAKYRAESDLDYLSAHAAFVTETGAKYHKYNCYHLSNSKGFWIYNVEAAKSKGYTACSDCW